MRENECECACECAEHERSLLLGPGSWANGPFPPRLEGPSRPPAALMGQVSPPTGVPSRSPRGFPCIVQRRVPRGNGAAVGCGGGPPATPPLSPHCHSWLWPLAPAADTKNSPAHRESAAPLTGPPRLVGGQVASTELLGGLGRVLGPRDGGAQVTSVKPH